jgi:hypothetical protein
MNKSESGKVRNKNNDIESVDFTGYQPVTKTIFDERVLQLLQKRRPKFEQFKERVMTAMVMADETDDRIERRLEELEGNEVVNAREWLLGNLENKPEHPLKIVSRKVYHEFKAKADSRIDKLRAMLLHASMPEDQAVPDEHEGVYMNDSDRPEVEA